MSKRTTHRSPKGTKLYAVRDKKGQRAHGADIKRPSSTDKRTSSTDRSERSTDELRESSERFSQAMKRLAKR